MSIRTIEIFSQKGGVGKTSLAILLAKIFSASEAVLIIDADLTGSCLGDCLAPTINWDGERGLGNCICERPEKLYDDEFDLPVYSLATPKSAGTKARIATKAEELKIGTSSLPENSIWFCPSHLYFDSGKQSRTLRALASHETSGEWVRLVINRISQETQKRLNTKLTVIVDHSPGVSALQETSLRLIRSSYVKMLKEEPNATELAHVALLVSAFDKADHEMCLRLLDREKSEVEGLNANGKLAAYLRFVANNLDNARFKSPGSISQPFRARVPFDPAISSSNFVGQLGQNPFAPKSAAYKSIKDLSKEMFKIDVKPAPRPSRKSTSKKRK